MGMQHVRVIEKSPTNRDGTPKFRTAEQAKQHRELQASWGELLKKHQVRPDVKPVKQNLSRGSLKQDGLNKLLELQRSLGRLPEKQQGNEPPRDLAKTFDPGISSYTGTAVIGVILQHKSTYVPVMSDTLETAIEVTQMRR